MSNVALPLITKNQTIGDSLKKINQSFESLKNTIDQQKIFSNEIKNFKDAINVFADQLRFSHDFLKNKQQTYLNTYEEINSLKRRYIKPLILFYPNKFRTDDNRITNSYIENVLYAWITKNYIIRKNTLSTPNYVEGQEAYVYFLRSNEVLKKSNLFTDTDTVVCNTKLNNTLSITCTSRRDGRICIRGCGCIDCGSTVSCQESKNYQCYFTDYGTTAKPSSVTRILRSKTLHDYMEYPETKFQYIRFIVDECLWKVIGSEDFVYV